MANFQTKNPDLGKSWRALQWKMLVRYMYIWSILLLFGMFCGHMIYGMVIWHIPPPFWYVVPTKKIWQSCLRGQRMQKSSRVKCGDKSHYVYKMTHYIS
jgi:hypothetical protein